MSESLEYKIGADIREFQEKMKTVENQLNSTGNQKLSGSLTNGLADLKGVTSKIGSSLSSVTGSLSSFGGGLGGMSSALASAGPYVAAFAAAVTACVAGVKAAIDGIKEAEIGEVLSQKLKLTNPFEDIDLSAYSEKYGISDEFLMQLILPILRNDKNNVLDGELLARTIWEASGMEEATSGSIAKELEKIAAGKEFNTQTLKVFQRNGIDAIQQIADILDTTSAEAEEMIKKGIKGDDALRLMQALLVKQAESMAGENDIDLGTLETKMNRASETWSNSLDSLWLAFRDGFETCSFMDSLDEFQEIVNELTPVLSTFFEIIGGVCGAIMSTFTAIVHVIRSVHKFIVDNALKAILKLMDLIPESFKPDFVKGLESTLNDWKKGLEEVPSVKDLDEVAKEKVNDLKGYTPPEDSNEKAKQEAQARQEEQKKQNLEWEKRHNERLSRYEQEKLQLSEQYEGELLKLKEREVELKKSYSQNWMKIYKEELKYQTEMGASAEEADSRAKEAATSKARQIYDIESKTLERDVAAYEQREALAAKERQTQQEIINLRLKGFDTEANRLEEELRKQQEIANLVKGGRTQEEAELYYNSQKELADKSFIEEYERQIKISELKAEGYDREAEMLSKQKAIQDDINKLISAGMSQEEATAKAMRKNMTLSDTVNKSVGAFQKKWGEFLKTIQDFQVDQDYKAGGGYNNVDFNQGQALQSYAIGINNVMSKEVTVSERIAGYLAPEGWLSRTLDKLNMGGAVYA